MTASGHYKVKRTFNDKEEKAMVESELSGDAPLKDDTLYGAKEIANFLGCTQRKVFYYKEKRLVPLGCIGSQIIGSKSALRQHFKAQMTAAE